MVSCAMLFEYDPERLIQEIEKRPSLWNYTDVNYKAMSARVTLWNEIVSALLDPNVKLSTGESRELVAQLQKKWKSLKDAYIKYLAKPNKTRKPYVYSRQLKFLDQRGTRFSNENNNGSDYSSPRKIRKRQKPAVTVKIEDDSTDEDDNDGNDSENDIEVPCASNDGYGSEKQATAKKPEEFAFANVDTILKSPEGEDCDKMFLLSLLPHLKSIPEEKRLTTKMKLLEVLQKGNM